MQNSLKYPMFAEMSQKYLSAPISEIDSERMFSGVKLIDTP